jgi:murein DD-endopeptidase MepM/ murein hydrolase activator NlpD
MSLTLIKHTPQGSKTMHVNTKLLVGALVASWLGVMVVGLGLGVGVGRMASTEVVTESAQNSIWQEEITAQKEAIEVIHSDIETELAALTSRFSMLQAHTLRLEVLGERLLEHTGLPKDDFNFTSEPGLGGAGDEKALDKVRADEVESELITLESRLERNATQLELLENILMDNWQATEKYVSGRPIKKGWMSSSFGRRADPFHGRPAWHKGMDFAGREGSEVVATGAGVVTWASRRSGYGNLVEINHGGGFATRYGHNKDILVNVGDVVFKGQNIATMGNTGRSTGAHVHYEVLKKGKAVNPAHYVYRKQKDFK